MLLSNLGVPDVVFEDMLKSSLNQLSEMLIDEQVARDKLQSTSSGVHWGSVCQSQFHITSEPYFRSLLMALYRCAAFIFG